MKPFLYGKTTTQYTTNGYGALADAASCVVTEEANGEYELELEYPVSGIHYDLLALDMQVLAKPNPTDQWQPFRIYRLSKPTNGRVTVYARHISYDLTGIPVSAFTAGSAAAAMAGLKAYAAIQNSFTMWTDKATTASFAVERPSSIRAMLGGTEGSILDVYGGEYEFDRYTVKLHSHRGEDRGVEIRYGKNLTSIQQDENCANVYTGVYPYWASEDSTVILPEKIVYAEGTYDRQNIMPLDLSSDFQEAPTEEQLRARAESYIESNNIGIPTVSIDVSFVQLEQSGEYADKALLERVSLFDTVSVIFPLLGVSAKAKCIKTVYDVLLERYISVSIGDVHANIADTIADTGRETQQQIEKAESALKTAVNNATAWITNGEGNVVIRRNAAGNPVEILIMDTMDISTAVKVWRWNSGGLGYSSNGYNGPYSTAMTQDGSIVANFITTGLLNANIIRTGSITSGDGNAVFDLDGNSMRFSDESGTVVLSFDPENGLLVNGHIEANSGNIGGFMIDENGNLTGATTLKVGGMTMMGSNIQGFKMTGENFTPDPAMYTPPTFMVRGSLDNFTSLTLEDLLTYIAASVRIGGTTYNVDLEVTSGSGGGGDPGTTTGSAYNLVGTNWRLRSSKSTSSSSNIIATSLNAGYVYVAGSMDTGGWFKVTRMYAASAYNDPSACSLAGEYTEAYISSDAIGSAVTVTYYD